MMWLSCERWMVHGTALRDVRASVPSLRGWFMYGCLQDTLTPPIKGAAPNKSLSYQQLRVMNSAISHSIDHYVFSPDPSVPEYWSMAVVSRPWRSPEVHSIMRSGSLRESALRYSLKETSPARLLQIAFLAWRYRPGRSHRSKSESSCWP